MTGKWEIEQQGNEGTKEERHEFHQFSLILTERNEETQRRQNHGKRFHKQFAQAAEAALQIKAPPRATYLRALMAELERLANHFGDIGAICNDASFSLMHAQCGILRERTLRAADACFGHRLMMDIIVPGGVSRLRQAFGPVFRRVARRASLTKAPAD